MSTDNTMSTPSTPSTPATPFTPEPYEIEVIQQEDKEEVLDLLRKFFICDEPLNVAIELLDNENPRCLELEEYSVKELDSGLNLKAVSNGKIIGVCLNGIIEKNHLDDEEGFQCSNKKFSKILGLLDHVAHESKIFDKFPGADKCMVVKILSVNNKYRGQGVAQNLMDRTREIAKERGCQLMSADCTSHFTGRALKKLGFNCIYELKYEDYKVDGEVVFKPAHPHTAVTVYTQKLE